MALSGHDRPRRRGPFFGAKRTSQRRAAALNSHWRQLAGRGFQPRCCCACWPSSAFTMSITTRSLCIPANLPSTQRCRHRASVRDAEPRRRDCPDERCLPERKSGNHQRERVAVSGSGGLRRIANRIVGFLCTGYGGHLPSLGFLCRQDTSWRTAVQLRFWCRLLARSRQAGGNARNSGLIQSGPWICAG
jgi:hypothetical protein